eukprot:TRINITY_DN10888_c0_g1_i1.p1 TRINITY_DN10888_c0_g1~~TRINITY_DN10888_c0_g1_i1.p1  ORF type:complete len:422 (-),score=98.95 TRINITY_DN10888_c0_g1_i1:37-1302(-)
MSDEKGEGVIAPPLNLLDVDFCPNATKGWVKDPLTGRYHEAVVLRAEGDHSLVVRYNAGGGGQEHIVSRKLFRSTELAESVPKTAQSWVTRDGTVIESNCAASASYPLRNLFDQRHGRTNSDGMEWWCQPGHTNPTVTVKFSKPKYIHFIRVYPNIRWGPTYPGNYSLSVLPLTAVSNQQLRNVSNGVVNVSQPPVPLGTFHDYHIDEMVQLVQLEIPDPTRAGSSCGSLEIFASVEAANPSASDERRFEFQDILETGMFSDIKLVVGREETVISAHRVILNQRCPYFKALFQSKMIDSTESSVYLPDVDPSSFMELLRLIYGAEFKFQLEEAVGLWNLADRFQMTDVCDFVEQQLLGTMDVKWAIRAFRTESFPENSKASEMVLEFLAARFKEVMILDEFLDLPKDKLKLIFSKMNSMMK